MVCTVIEDNSYNDITVEFEDGTIIEHTNRAKRSLQSIRMMKNI